MPTRVHRGTGGRDRQDEQRRHHHQQRARQRPRAASRLASDSHGVPPSSEPVHGTVNDVPQRCYDILAADVPRLLPRSSTSIKARSAGRNPLPVSRDSVKLVDMPHFPKPAEGSWTEHYPGLGTGPVSYEDSISPAFFELERKAIFARTWLNVGRVEQLPRVGSYFTREIDAARTSIVVVRAADGEVRAFHNMCRHRGNKLVWQDYPGEETSGTCRQFTCKYHGWRYDLEGDLNFVQQEGEFFDLDKEQNGLVPVHCEVWSGFIFVNVAPE